MMQPSRIYTKPFRLSDALAVTPVTRKVCDLKGLSFDVLTSLEFEIIVTDDELILRAPLPKDKALSNNAPEAAGDVQR